MTHRLRSRVLAALVPAVLLGACADDDPLPEGADTDGTSGGQTDAADTEPADDDDDDDDGDDDDDDADTGTSTGDDDDDDSSSDDGPEPVCGDGVLNEDAGETCDYGDDNGASDCNEVCQLRGTILGTVSDSVNLGLDPSPARMRATMWNGRIAVVAGGPRTSVWEIDPETLESIDLRHAFTNGPVDEISGAVGLDSGQLLVVGGTSGKQAVMLDDNLDVEWEFESFDDVLGGDRLVGAARRPGGAFMGADHRDSLAGTADHWVVAIADDGDLAWQAISPASHDGVQGHDLRGLAGSRAVHLTDAPGASVRFRIYDNQGEIVAAVDPMGITTDHDRLCPGREAFGIVADTGHIVGFSSDGDARFDITLPAVDEGEVVGTGCGMDDDGSAIAARNVTIGSAERLILDGYRNDILEWSHELPHNYGDAGGPPEVFIEDHRAWIFISGPTNGTARYMHAVVIAI